MKQATVLCPGKASDGPYGIDRLENLGVKLAEVSEAHTRTHRKLRDTVEHRLGFPVDKAVRSTRLAHRSDYIITFLEKYSIMPAYLKRFGVPGYRRIPLITIACWLADELSAKTPEERQRTVKQYRGIDRIFVFSSNQIPLLLKYGFKASQLRSISFGFAPEQFIFTPQIHKDIPLLAVGFDRGRDYKTLMAAVQGIDTELMIACKDENLTGIDIPANVHKLGLVPFSEYKQLIHRAQTVVIPTHELAYPTGQTVALEAAATGSTVVVTATTPMKEYFSTDIALMPDPHSPHQLHEAITRAVSDLQLRTSLGEKASAFVHEHYTYQHMWQAILTDIEKL